MEFTDDPLVRYALNGDVPARSYDGGATWTNIPPDPYSQSVYCLYADPFSTNRLLVSDYSTLKISTNSGTTYANRFTSNDLLIAGAFWNGPRIYYECAMGFTVCATDPNRAVISDFGFIHATTNDGATWRQAYDWRGCENAAGVSTPKTISIRAAASDAIACPFGGDPSQVGRLCDGGARHSPDSFRRSGHPQPNGGPDGTGLFGTHHWRTLTHLRELNCYSFS